MSKQFLNLDFGKTQMYEYNKTAKEGFEEYESKTGKISYRKYFNKGVFGILQSVGLFDSQNGGKDLSLTLKDGENTFYVKLGLNDQRGNFDNRFIEPLITILPNLELGTAYRIYPWMMESETAKNKQGNFYRNYGVSVKIADLDTYEVSDKVERTLVSPKKDENYDAKKHLPALIFHDDFGTWRPTVESTGAIKQVLGTILKEELERLGYKDNNKSEASATAKSEAPKNKQATPLPEVNSQQSDANDPDDLPF